jgi:beta-glucosidase
MAKIPIFLVGFWLLSTWAGLLETDEDIIKYKNPKESVNIRVEDLISKMTLDEKIGQMLQIERKYASNGVMKKYFIGKDNVWFLLFNHSIRH